MYLLRFLVIAAVLPGWAVRADATEQRIAADGISIRFAPEDDGVARESLDILRKGLRDYGGLLPAGDIPIEVVLCGDFAQFKRLAGEYGQSSVSGLADTGTGLILVKTPGLLPPDADYGAILRHELLHVLLARNTTPENVPRWFGEGVAMLLSREIRWESGFRVAQMYVRGRLIPYIEMNLAFGPTSDEVQFGDAYAQAFSITQFLEERVGAEKFRGLVRALEAQPFEEALRDIGGLTPAQLYKAWHRSLWKVALVTSLVSGFSVFQIMAILVVVVYFRKWRRGRRLLRQWEEEERLPRSARNRLSAASREPIEEEPYPWEFEEDDEWWY